MKSTLVSLAWLELPLLVVLVAVVSSTGGSIDEALRYAAFHGLFVVLPALALGRAAVPHASLAGQIALGGPAAYGALVFFATVGIVLRLPALAFGSPVLAAAWLAFRTRRAPEEGAPIVAAGEAPLPLLLASVATTLLATALLYVFFAWPSRAPTDTLATIHFHDNIWTLGNTRSLLSWGLPLRDIRIDGYSLGYHLGQNVVQSVAVRFFGLDPFAVMFRLEPFGTLQLLVLGLVFGPFVALRSRWWVGPLLAVLLFATDGRGLGLYQTSYWNPVSFAVSVGPFVVFQLVLMGHLEQRITRLPVVLASLCFLMMGATKGILLGFVPLALGVTLAVRFVRARRWPWTAVTRDELFLGVGLVAAALFLTKTLFAAVASTGLAAQLSTEGKTGLGALSVIAAEAARTSSDVLTAGAIVPVTLCVVLVYPQARRGWWRSEASIYAGVLAVGMVLFWSVLRLHGAIFYFRWYPALALSLLAPLVFERAWGLHGEETAVDESSASPTRRRLLLAAASLCVAFGLVTFVKHARPLFAGFAAPPLAGRVPWTPEASVDRGEWEAMRWLSAHSARDDRFLSDRYAIRQPPPSLALAPVFFAYSALSGRQAFAEGSHFSVPAARPAAAQRTASLEAFLAAPTSSESAAFLRATQARWFVQSRRFDPRELGDVPAFTLRFENASVRIYEISR